MYRFFIFPEVSLSSLKFLFGLLQVLQCIASVFHRFPQVFRHTLEFVSKKHVKFDQGLDSLISSQGNGRQIDEAPKKHNEQEYKTGTSRKNNLQTTIETVASFLIQYYLFKKSVCFHRVFVCFLKAFLICRLGCAHTADHTGYDSCLEKLLPIRCAGTDSLHASCCTGHSLGT